MLAVIIREREREREVWLVAANDESVVVQWSERTSKEWSLSLDKVVVIVSRPGTFRPSQARPGQARHNTVKGSAQLSQRGIIKLKCTCCNVVRRAVEWKLEFGDLRETLPTTKER